MDKTHARLVKCFQAVFPELTVDEVVRANPASVPRWDSVESFTLLAVIEEEFRLHIDVQHPQEFASFEGFLSYLRKREEIDAAVLNGQAAGPKPSS